MNDEKNQTMEIEDLTIEKYEWGNKILTVRENKIIHKKLQSDPDFASRYFSKFVGPENDNNEESKISSEEEFCEDLVWSYDAVKLLVNEYQNRLHRFNNPKIKNNRLWKEIAEVFKKQNKPYPVRAISRKFFNMKTTYYKITKNKRRIKVGRRPWPWIKAMEEILKKDNSANLTNDKITVAEKSDNNENTTTVESTVEPNKLSSNNPTDPIESTNNSSSEGNAENKDDWEMIDDTSNFSSSLGISSDHDFNSSNSQNLPKDISDYKTKMLDLKTEEVKILKLIHKDVDDDRYSKMEVVSELTTAIKEHNVILKELIDVLKERLLNK
ncbi:uncharacterized protein LOC123258859 [Cotesia glomerata]|uniref:Myb/SANT-like DNA-binding domain-containing protein n=1 Tax=Cotesia glomerata TaxID=32391 RepID=A0AAV7I3L4_COTGL|nr:uncharacterized protein LOC123258859 [Cotesia glomerata]KAH0540569.1 hypothetical protein KQX54_018326 [Cotesia glomerata]